MNSQSQFVPLVGYEGLYEINRDLVIMSAPRIYIDAKGRKRSVKGRVIISRVDRAGYLTVMLINARKRCGTQYVHRQGAKTFLPNPFNKPFVNHINGNKLDNTLENLEWVTPAENHRHAVAMGLCKAPFKKTKVVDLCEEIEFESIVAASRYKRIDYEVFKKMLYGLIPNPTCMFLAAW